MKVKNIFLLCCYFTVLLPALAQTHEVTISGSVKDKATQKAMSYVNVVLKSSRDSTFFAGTITDEEGQFSFSGLTPSNYLLEIAYLGYQSKQELVFVGSLSSYLQIPTIDLQESTTTLEEIVVVGKQDELSGKMEKKTFAVADNISQSGGSVLQTMQNLPGITLQDGKVQLRGNDKVTILMDGKQTALTGFGGQSGLDNLPASAIEKIEIINNPSSKFDANGNAGIINIVLKKNKKEGFNGKVGLSSGVGALWGRKENLPTIRPQYQATPKINPSVSLNYLKGKVNAFYKQTTYIHKHSTKMNLLQELMMTVPSSSNS